MDKAKRARTAETPKQPSLGLKLRAPYLYPDLPDLMEVRVSKNARATVARRGLKEAWSKCASRLTNIGYKA